MSDEIGGMTDEQLRSIAMGQYGDPTALTIGGPKRGGLYDMSEADLHALANPAPAAPDTRDLPSIRNDYLTASKAGDTAGAQKQAESYVRQEQAQSPIMMGIADRIRQFAKGVPIIGGVADEANAGISALTGGDYNEALDYQRARDRVFEADRPKESTGLQVGGGLASAFATLPSAAAAGAVKGGSFLANLARSALAGGAIGGADGFTRGEGGVGNRAKDAGLGALIGGGIGAAVPALAKGISKGVSSLADTFTTNRDLKQLGISRPVGDILNRVMGADEALGPVGAANIFRGGPQAMLADAGPSASGLLDAAIQRGGPAASQATQAINQRASRATRDVTTALDRSLGYPAGLETAETAIRQGSAGARKGTYDAAYAQPVNYVAGTGRGLEEAIHQVPGDIIAAANRLMKLKGAKSKQILADIADDGSVTYREMPDVQQLDYITRALNNAAKSGDGQGALGGQTPMGAAYQDLARSMRNMLRQNVPEYGHALDTAADAIGRREALVLGGDLLSSKVARDEVAHAVAGMSRAELEAAKQGIRSQIDDVIANVTRIASDPNIDAREGTKALRELSSKSAREKVASVIGQKEAVHLFGQLDVAARAFELRAATAQNSKTFARTAIDQTTDQMTTPGAFGLLMQGKPAKAGQSALQKILGTGPERQLEAKDKIYAELAKLLTQPRGMDAVKIANRTSQAYLNKGQMDRSAQILGQLGSRLIAGGAYPAIRQQSSR